MNRPVDKIFPVTAAFVAVAKEKGQCWVCENPAKPKIHTEAGEREYQISGVCEECFDRMFEEE